MVYWIRPIGCQDVTEGYVGITSNLKRRISQHKHCALRNNQTYHKDFIKTLISGSYDVSVEYVGSRELCESFEYQLRPDNEIGWNKYNGGSHKHNLTNEKSYKSLKNIFSKVGKSCDLELDDYLRSEKGALEFHDLYMKNMKRGTLIILPEKGLVSLDTISFKQRSEITRLKFKHKFENGFEVNLSDFAEELGIKQNTLQTQIKRGWSYEKIIEVNLRKRGVLGFEH